MTHEIVVVSAIAMVLYVIKALPFAWRFVPRGPAADRVFDLLPVALLMAMVIPPVVKPLIASPPAAGSLVAVAAVIASFATCILTRKAALGIGVGLALLALGEFV